MRWFRKRAPCPTEEAQDAVTQARRARRDAENLHRRVECAADALRETSRRNHIAEALEQAIRPRRVTE